MDVLWASFVLAVFGLLEPAFGLPLNNADQRQCARIISTGNTQIELSGDGTFVRRIYSDPGQAAAELARFQLVRAALDLSGFLLFLRSKNEDFLLPAFVQDGPTSIQVEFVQGENLQNLLTSSRVDDSERRRLIDKFNVAARSLGQRLKRRSGTFISQTASFDSGYFRQNPEPDDAPMYFYAVYKSYALPIVRYFLAPDSEILVKTDNVLWDPPSDRLILIDPN